MPAKNALFLEVIEASNVSAMDKSGTSDPYCRISVDFNRQAYKTAIKYKTLDPVWNEKFDFFDPKLDGHILIKMWDKDKWSSDDFLGEVRIDLASVPANEEQDKWFDLENEPKKVSKPKREVGVPARLHLKIHLKTADADKAKSAPKSSAGGNTLEDNYKIGKELGRGGFSIVKEAFHKKTQEKYAVKIISKADVPEDELELLHREIDIMHKLKHPHIVQLVELFETKNDLFLVLELVKGGELFDQIVDRGSYSERDAADICKQILLGVKYMHENGVAHRDLKPENLLCGGDKGEVIKIADFGLSKDFGQSNLSTSLGTPGYVAPEVLLGEPYDNAVDIWSIGVICYVLLCGFTPFYGDNQRELFEQIMKADYSFPDPEWTNISKEGKDFIANILVTNPAKRLTADSALKHPWIVDKAPARELPNMQSFRNILGETKGKSGKK